MAIETYEDITSIDRKLVCLGDVDEITSCDLHDEAEKHLVTHPVVEHLLAGAFNTPKVEVVYFPELGRAGVSAGGNAEWTDAASAQDALEQFFGVDGKEMCN